MSGDEVIGALLTECRPRAIAALLRGLRDLDLAEDAYQQACLRAAERWPSDGLPDNPTSWLIKVARNAGIDAIRRKRRQRPLDAALELHDREGAEADISEAIDRSEYRDDVLRLMFLCCHPGLQVHEQLALALKVVVGLSVAEIARAFLVSPDAMQRRLSRAKARAARVASGLDAPGLAERAARVSAVQKMIYLLFNEGYASAASDEHIRHTLCVEAIRLARLLLEIFPSQPETMGLLALCLLQHARASARVDSGGSLVPLERQDRLMWDSAMIAEGRVLLEKALLGGQPGPLQVQAAIAAVHCAAERAEATDWAEIERLYVVLETMMPSPVVRLNRAVATARMQGPGPALETLEDLADDLRQYRPYHAVRAALLEERGDHDAAIEALHAALGCRPTRQELAYLTGKIASLKRENEPTD